MCPATTQKTRSPSAISVPTGSPPACAKVCAPGAIRYGARDALLVFARQAGYSKVYGEKDLRGLGALYAFRDAPKVYGMGKATSREVGKKDGL